jgi:hypothetical protein
MTQGKTVLGWGGAYFELAVELGTEASARPPELPSHEGKRAAAAIFSVAAALETILEEAIFLCLDGGELTHSLACEI